MDFAKIRSSMILKRGYIQQKRPMNTLKIFFLLLFISCGAFQVQTFKYIDLGLTCHRQAQGCIKVKGNENKELWIRSNDGLRLEVEKSFVIFDPHSETLVLSISLKDKLQLADFTRSYLGHEAYIRFEGETIYYSQIQAQIANGLLLFPMGKIKNKERVMRICRRMDPSCPSEVSSLNFKTKYDGPKIGFVDLDVIEKNYSGLNESLMWYSPQSSNFVFSDREMILKGKIKNNTPVANMNPKQPLYFVGAQDYSEGQYSYSNKAIKLQSIGWVDRKELIPGNILRSPNLLKNELTSFMSLKKCAGTYGSTGGFSRSFTMILSSFNKLGEKFIRDTKMGICAHVGESDCKKVINKVDQWVSKVDCNRFPTLFSVKDIDKAVIKELEKECFKENKVFSCFVLKERFTWSRKNKKLIEVYKHGCQLNNYEMCFDYGLKTKERRENTFLNKSCENGLTSACHQLAFKSYKKGEIKKSKRMYKKNCENHNYQSCSNLGGIYLSEKKYKTAYPYLLKSCRFNNPTGCYNLSCYYSLNEDIQSSLRKLEKSLLLGIPVDDWLKKDDPDLEFIRKTLEFKVLIKNFSDH